MKKIKRKVIILLIIISVFMVLMINSINLSYASDKTITCGNTECNSLSDPLFHEINILPGDKIIKTVSIVNNRNESIGVKIYADKKSDTDDILLNVISVSVIRNGNIFSNTLLDKFLDGRKIDVGVIEPGSSTEIIFEALFSPNAGNIYQRKTAIFDIFINVEGDDISPTPTPTATPTSTISPLFPPFPTLPPLPSILGCKTSRFPCLPSISKIMRPPSISSVMGNDIMGFLRRIIRR